MFTGLVEEAGEVIAVNRTSAGATLVVAAPTVAEGTRIGDSVAANGCCLTVATIEENRLGFDLLDETLKRTNLGALRSGSLINLERALPANGRLGGHFVQGHIDGTGEVFALERVGADYRLEVELPADFARYVVFKGSIAINGISLTVAEVRSDRFVMWIIPHTWEVTNLRALAAGDLVNLEFDLLAKYVERLMQR